MVPNLIRTCLAAVLIVCSLTHAAAGDDWHRWRGPQQTGVSSEANWLDKWPDGGPPIAWRAAVGTGFSSITIADGCAMTMGNEDNTDTIYCLNADTGKTIWKHSYECPLDDRFFEGGPTSTPTIDGKHVYTLSRQGDLFCFHLKTGAVAWSKNVAEEMGVRIPGWGFGGSPVVDQGLLLLNVGDAGAALEKKTGKVVWSSADRDAGYCTPVLTTRAGQSVAILASGKFFQAIEAATGKVLWRHRWLTRFGANAADAIVDGEHVFISSGYNRGCALLRISNDKPEVVWKSKDMQNQMNSSVLVDGHIYGIDGDTTSETRLKCMEFATGETKWSADGIGSGSLMAANGKLVILSEDGELVIAPASPKQFSPTARASVLNGKCWTVPTLANGRIYCRNADGDVVCVDVRKK